MKRYIIYNPLTNKQEMVWGDYSIKKKVMNYFSDLSKTKEVDVSHCQFGDSELETYFDLFGFECGEYWFPILQPVFDYIDTYNDNPKNKEKIIVQRVSSVDKHVDIQLNFKPHSLESIIDDVVEQTSHVCEFCGGSNTVKHLYYENPEDIHRKP